MSSACLLDDHQVISLSKHRLGGNIFPIIILFWEFQNLLFILQNGEKL
jgi:hypothetical protein